MIEDTERMFWGRKLESAIAEGVAEKQEWKVEPLKSYGRIEEDYELLRAGSSFDYKITVPFEGLLEIKNVDGLQLKKNWTITDGEVVEAPPYIEMQAQFQLMVSGLKRLYIAALVGGNQVVLLERKPDAQIIEAMKQRLYDFWKSIDENSPPEPDFKKDYEFIKTLYQEAEEGKVISFGEDAHEIECLAKQYDDYAKQIKELELSKEAVKAEILTKIGNAERAIGENFSISAKEIGPASYTVDRKGYRNFRVNYKGDKND